MENELSQLRTLFDQSLNVYFTEYEKSTEIFDTPYVQRNLENDLNDIFLNKSIWLCGEIVDYNKEFIAISIPKDYSVFKWEQVNYNNQYSIEMQIGLVINDYKVSGWGNLKVFKLADRSFQEEMIGKLCKFKVFIQDAWLHVCSGEISGVKHKNCIDNYYYTYKSSVHWQLMINAAEASELEVINEPIITPAYFGHQEKVQTEKNQEKAEKNQEIIEKNRKTTIIPTPSEKIRTSKKKWIFAGILLMILIAWFSKDITNYFFPLTLSKIKGEWKVSEVNGAQLSAQDKSKLADLHFLIKDDSLFIKPSLLLPYQGFISYLSDGKLILSYNASKKDSLPIVIIDENNFELSWQDYNYGTLKLKFKRLK
jgi:hypothetical protein